MPFLLDYLSRLKLPPLPARRTLFFAGLCVGRWCSFVVLRFKVQSYIQSVPYTSSKPDGALQAALSRFRCVDMFTGVRF